MISQNDITLLSDSLSALLKNADVEAARRISSGWPETVASTPAPISNDLPVTKWLPQTLDNAPKTTAGLVRALAENSNRLRWQQTYTRDDLGQQFLDRYGWVMLVGPNALIHSDALLAGFLLLGPDVEYPVHKHSAEEVYVILSGRASWKVGAADWHQKPAGSIIHNPPWQPHGMRTDQGEPLLLGFMWNAATIEKSKMANKGPTF